MEHYDKDSFLEPIADSQVEDYSTIEWEREDESALGFSISGGTDDSHFPGVDSPFVTGIKPFSQAYVDGRIQVGDRIVALNGVPLQNMTHQEIISEFRKSGKRVSIVLDAGAEMRIFSEVSRTKSLVEPEFSKRTADFANGLPTAVPSDPMPPVDLTQEISREEKQATREVAQSDKRSFLLNGAICVSIGVALGAVAVFAFKVARS